MKNILSFILIFMAIFIFANYCKAETQIIYQIGYSGITHNAENTDGFCHQVEANHFFDNIGIYGYGGKDESSNNISCEYYGIGAKYRLRFEKNDIYIGSGVNYTNLYNKCEDETLRKFRPDIILGIRHGEYHGGVDDKFFFWDMKARYSFNEGNRLRIFLGLGIAF